MVPAINTWQRWLGWLLPETVLTLLRFSTKLSEAKGPSSHHRGLRHLLGASLGPGLSWAGKWEAGREGGSHRSIGLDAGWLPTESMRAWHRTSRPCSTSWTVTQATCPPRPEETTQHAVSVTPRELNPSRKGPPCL